MQHFHNTVLPHGSDVSVCAKILRAGYYLPHNLKKLAKYRNNCVICRKIKMRYLYTKMGSIGPRRMTPSAPFEYLQSDLKGPLFISEHVNKRSTRKVWLMSNICNFSRYISISVVEDLSTEAILNTFMGHVFCYGNNKQS